MKKPPLKTIIQLKNLDDKISELYKKRSEARKKLMEKYGEGIYCHQLATPTEAGEKYIKIQLIDNKKKLNEEGVIYKAASLVDIDADIKYLKRTPKEGL